MLARSAPDANSTVAPRRVASSPHALVASRTASSIVTEKPDTPRILAARERRREIPGDACQVGAPPARRSRRRGRRRDVDLPAVTSRTRRSCRHTAWPARDCRAAHEPTPGPGARPIPGAAIRGLARSVCPWRLGHQHRHGSPGAHHARRRLARDGAPGRAVADPELPGRARAGSAPGGSHRLALRNALTPVVILLGLSLPALFSGAVFVEAVFAWPGVGRVLVEAVRARDYPVVMAATAVSAVLVVAGNLLADLLAAWLDPRVRRPVA